MGLVGLVEAMKTSLPCTSNLTVAIIRKDESGELAAHCRQQMKHRRKAFRWHETKAANIRNRVSINQRPAEADGKHFGDWEMDPIVDKDSNAILTFTERSTNFLLMEKLSLPNMNGLPGNCTCRCILPITIAHGRKGP